MPHMSFNDLREAARITGVSACENEPVCSIVWSILDRMYRNECHCCGLALRKKINACVPSFARDPIVQRERRSLNILKAREIFHDASEPRYRACCR